MGSIETMNRAINNVLKILRFEFSRFQRLVDKHKRTNAKIEIEPNPTEEMSVQLHKETR